MYKGGASAFNPTTRLSTNFGQGHDGSVGTAKVPGQWNSTDMGNNSAHGIGWQENPSRAICEAYTELAILEKVKIA